MTSLQDTVPYDKLSGSTPGEIEANWAATASARSLLQKVREFRIRTHASYNDDSKKIYRRALENAELELQSLTKESFRTRKVLMGVEKLKIALKAAEDVMVRGPDPKIMTSETADADEADTRLERALQGTEEDGKIKKKAALRVKSQTAGHPGNH